MEGIPTDSARRRSTLHEYLRVLRRRKWIVIATMVLFAGLAAGLSSLQQDLYEAEAEVLLSRQNLAAQLTNTEDPTANLQADRIAETQASIAEVPEVAQRVLRATGSKWTADEFLDRSSVEPRRNADLLLFRVSAPSAAVAQRLTTTYANEFTRYRRELDTAALSLARNEVRTRMRVLRRRGEEAGTLYTNLADKDQQLSTLQTLQTSNSFVVRPATQATQVQPRTLLNIFLGLAFGALVGLALAFLRDTLDTRLRDGQEIAEVLGLPLLGSLAPPPKRVEREKSLVMLSEPKGIHAEAFRLLRANISFARLDRPLKTIIVTSALEGEGKSTTAANLAIAFARDGRRTVLVDLDLRRPRLAEQFGIFGPGITDVALGQAELAEALVPVELEMGEEEHAGANGDAHRHTRELENHGELLVLPSGFIPALAGEFLGTSKIAEILSAVSDQADVVIIDSPPMMRVGDVLALSPKLDGLLLLARLDVVRRPMLADLRRMLEAAPITKLGVVVAGPGDEGNLGYYGYAYGERTPSSRSKRRPVKIRG